MRNLRTITTIALLCATLALAGSQTACNTSETAQFKSIAIGGINAVDAFSDALNANPNVSQNVKAKILALRSKLDPTKAIIQAITVFPPANRQELADLLKDVLPVLQSIAGDSSLGTTISIAASVAIAFFQTESDMLSVKATPSGAAGAPVDPAARLPELKAKLKALQDAVKNLK